MYMKSTKYQLLKDDYDFACKELSLHKKSLNESKEKIRKYEDALKRIATTDTEPYLYKHWAEQALSR